MTRKHLATASLLSCLTLLAAQDRSIAYTGGPIRAEVMGYDPTESKVFYVLHHDDHSEDTGEVYYLDLTRTDPAKPIRAPSLESLSKEETSSEVTLHWRKVRKRLIPLTAVRRPDLGLDVKSVKSGVEKAWGQTRYNLTVEANLGSRRNRATLAGFCKALVRAKAVYLIPERPEVLVVLSYVGNPYGCEEVEAPLLLW